MVSGGVLRADASQLQCLERLQELLESLYLYGGKLKSYEEEHAAYQLKRQLAEEELSHHGQHGQHGHQQQNSGGGGTTNSGWNFSQFFNSFKEKEQLKDVNRISNKETRLVSLLGPPPSAPSAPKGMYLHGSVGSGKTMLLDMLYNAALESQVLPLQRRLHCNAALLELHSRMHTLEKHSFVLADDNTFDPLGKNAKVARIAHRRLVRERMLTPMEEYEKEIAAGNSSIMLKAARELLSSSSSFNSSLNNNSSLNKTRSKKNAALLCFDEMQTTDPYNVAALKALTEAALEDGGSIVATSNRAPKELSPHGLHEAMFEHFIERLERGCDVVELSSPEDYRRRVVAATKKENYYFWPLNANSAKQLESAWKSLPGEEITKSIEIPVMFGRTLTVRKHRSTISSSSKEEEAAWFDFDELCGHRPPRGPSDYIALASRFKTIFITNVPAMSMRVRDKARRFITLIDEVYNQRGRVVCTAAVELDELFTGKDTNEEPLVDLEGLQFEVGPVVATPQRLAALGGEEERFAFARAVSRLYEMNTSEIY